MDNAACTRLLLGKLERARRDHQKNPNGLRGRMWAEFLEAGILRGRNVDSEAAVWWVHEYMSGEDHPDSISRMISEDIHAR